MDLPVLILFFIIGISTIMFVTEVFSVDKIGFLVLVSLFMTGLVSGEEAISGFSNPAVITIMSLMIITAALEINGSIGLLSSALIPIIKFPLRYSLPLLMLCVGGFSAFISTTAVVILFVRIMPELSQKHSIVLEKYMMPISFAGILGGSCTLMGTSTNLIVNQIAVRRGLESLDFFGMTSLAIILLVLGVMITSVMAIFCLKIKGAAFANQQPQTRYISLLKVLENNPIIGKSYKSTELYQNSNSDILQIQRGTKVIRHPSYWRKIKRGDVLVISSNKQQLLDLNTMDDFESISQHEHEGEEEYGGAVIELLILPDSQLIGKTFAELDTLDLNGGMPLAITKHRNVLNSTDKFIENRLSRVRIDPGDRLVIQLSSDEDNDWTFHDNSMIMEHQDHPKINQSKKYVTLGILVISVGLAALGVLPILESALFGVALLLITQSLTLERAYQAINWQIIFLLVGLLPLGIAMNNTGADVLIGKLLYSIFDGQNPRMIVSILFLVTMLISSIISNNATAIIITPIAISLAQGLGLNPIAFLIVIMLAANFSFFTPIGYQTNTIIYGMGIYRFRDFILVGGVLSFILWMAATFLIPILFPF